MNLVTGLYGASVKIRAEGALQSGQSSDGLPRSDVIANRLFVSVLCKTKDAEPALAAHLEQCLVLSPDTSSDLS